MSAPAPARPSKFFAALDRADERIAELDELRARVDVAEWRASFAPPVTSGGRCSCGSAFEVRSSQIEATEQEKQASADAIAEIYGHRGSDSPVYAQLVTRVIDAINNQRTTEDRDALRDWQDQHAYCQDHS